MSEDPKMPPVPPAPPVTPPPYQAAGAPVPPPPGAGHYVPPVKRKGMPLIAKLLIIFGVIGFFGLFILFMFVGVFASLSGSSSYTRTITTEIYQDGDSSKRIAIIPVSGLIDFGTASHMENVTDEIIADDTIKAIVLRVESGGGYVAPSDRILRFMNQLKTSRPDVKVVASFGAIAASGAYYISMASDEIYAEPTTVTGSIGVISQAFTFEGTLDKLGMEAEVITAGDQKDTANNPFRSWTDKDRDKIRKIIVPMHEQFIAHVVAGRDGKATATGNLDEEAITALANGDVWIGEEAKAIGLVDHIGYLDNAVNAAAKMAGVMEPEVVVLRKRIPTFFEQMAGAQVEEPKAGTSFDLSTLSGKINSQELRNLINELASPKAMYLYLP